MELCSIQYTIGIRVIIRILLILKLSYEEVNQNVSHFNY